MAVPQLAYPAERGAVLILGAACSDSTCIVDSYGSGSIVKLDERNSAAYVLTARHVARGADHLYVLYDPVSFPSDRVFDLEDGVVPEDITAVLTERGHTGPVEVRSGIPSDTLSVTEDDRVHLWMESWVLSGGGRQYLALPRTEHLELYHLLPATLIRESDAELGVALLVVGDLPSFENEPITYMVAPDSIANGTKVTTFGCECGPHEGISQAEVQGTVVSSHDGFLYYDAALAHQAFSGGPVFLGDYVVAMNLCQEQAAGFPVRARIASTFKELVDEWIDLPRMKVDFFIDSPEGARDGAVSTDQEFTVRASAYLDPEGQVLAPVAVIGLELPDMFHTETEHAGVLVLGEEVAWTLFSPPRATECLPIRIAASSGSESTPLGELMVSTEEGVHLRCVLVEGPLDGAKLFLGEDFSVAVRFEQSGQTVRDFSGDVSVDINRRQFETLDGRLSRRIEIGEPIRWRLKPQDTALRALVSFRVDLQSVDRNGKPISVELPEPIGISVLEDRRFRLDLGVGGMIGEDVRGFDFGLGAKYRLANVMHRGVTVLLGGSVATGIDHLSVEHIDDAPAAIDEAIVLGYRSSAGVNLTVGFGAPEVSFEVGYMWFGTWVDVETLPEPMMHLKTEPYRSLYLQPGIAFHVSEIFSLFAGVRVFSDPDRTEYFLQVRVRKGAR